MIACAFEKGASDNRRKYPRRRRRYEDRSPPEGDLSLIRVRSRTTAAADVYDFVKARHASSADSLDRRMLIRVAVTRATRSAAADAELNSESRRWRC